MIRENGISQTITAIIQARIDSSRLPEKALLDLGGKPLLYHVIERTKAIPEVDTVVLATSEGSENHPLINLAKSMDIETISGSRNNVL